MEIRTPSDSILLQRIVEDGVILRIGSFSIGIKIHETEVAREILALYEGYPFDLRPALSDFRIELKPPTLLRAWGRRQVQAYIDGQAPFRPMARHLGVPMLESAINWCIGKRIARYLLIHAAVVEREGRAVVMPGVSGAGKSTLTAALVANGWRLLSDEVAIIDPRNGLLQPHPRPISLKNESIDLIASRYPQLATNKHYEGTPKGRVAYLKAPLDAIHKAESSAQPFLVMVLKYDPGADLNCDRLEKARAFMLLVKQSPNYTILLERGFQTMANFVEACDHYTLTYSELDKAMSRVNELCRTSAGGTEGT